jgi:hypothetical protein
VDLLVWGTVENLLPYRFAAEFLSEDRFQFKIIGFRLAGHKGCILPEVSERTAAPAPHDPTARAPDV